MQRYPGGSLVPTVLETLRAGSLLSTGELVVLAVSGGPDSICLLHCLQALRATLDLRLHVAYVHHGLRTEADDEADFVRGQAAVYGLPFTALRVDVLSLRRNAHLSLQDAARRARYAALRDLVAGLGGGSIATGHTQDDQAETLLLHLLRGSGIDGLAAMRPRQADLVRPLLAHPRSAVESHCRVHELSYRLDASNTSHAYRRNAVRHDLLPALEAYNPRVRGALARCAASLAQDADYLRAQAEEALAALLLPAAQPREVRGASVMMTLDRHRFAALPVALRLHTLRLALERLLASTAGFTHEHLAVVDALACSGRSGRRWQLPHGLRVEAVDHYLCLDIGEAAGQTHSTASAAVSLSVPGVAHFGEWRFETDLRAMEGLPERLSGLAGGPYEVWCDKRVGTAFQVRSRLPGDRLHPLGLDGTKKLQDLFVDRKVRRAQRDFVPLVVGAHGIIWVVGITLTEQARLSSGSSEAIHIRAWLDDAAHPYGT